VAALFEPPRAKPPAFMTTEAWETRMLSTGAAAWADLRRAPANVIEPTEALRAALPTTEGACAMVEPYPELYVRIEDLVGHVRDTLWEHELLDRNLSDRLDAYASFVGGLERSCFGIFGAGTLVEISRAADGRAISTMGFDDPQPFIAAAFSDLSTGIAIDVGLGRPDLLYLEVEQDGETTTFGGVISSFYEIERRVETARRLGSWERQFETGSPERPRWAMEFVEE